MARLDHHVALRTADIEAATRFWTQSLDAEDATAPVLRSGGYLDELFAPDVQVRISYVTFETGAIELFEFVEPRRDVPASVQVGDGLMHFGVTVDDVPAALARVEAAGGRRRLDVKHVGGREEAPRFVYCESPEGHVFELMEMTRDETVAQIRITLALLEQKAAS